jgi:hypothetical protein
MILIAGSSSDHSPQHHSSFTETLRSMSSFRQITGKSKRSNTLFHANKPDQNPTHDDDEHPETPHVTQQVP